MVVRTGLIHLQHRNVFGTAVYVSLDDFADELLYVIPTISDKGDRYSEFALCLSSFSRSFYYL